MGDVATERQGERRRPCGWTTACPAEGATLVVKDHPIAGESWKWVCETHVRVAVTFRYRLA